MKVPAYVITREETKLVVDAEEDDELSVLSGFDDDEVDSEEDSDNEADWSTGHMPGSHGHDQQELDPNTTSSACGRFCRWDSSSVGHRSCSMETKNNDAAAPSCRRTKPRRMNTFSSDKLSCSNHGLSSLPRSVSKNSKLSYRKQSLSRRDLMSQASNSARTIKTETSFYSCTSRSMRLATSGATPPQKPQRNTSYESLTTVSRV